jgi:hypothetical protein
MVSEDVVPVMVYKFNLSVSISLPVGKVISCGKITVCFTLKDVLFDIIGEIISCSSIDSNKGSGVTWVKWVFQLSCDNTGVKAFKMEDLLLLTVGVGIVDWDDLQDAMVNGVTFSEDHIYFGVVRINVIINEGGDDKVARGWIRDVGACSRRW